MRHPKAVVLLLSSIPVTVLAGLALAVVGLAVLGPTAVGPTAVGVSVVALEATSAARVAALVATPFVVLAVVVSRRRVCVAFCTATTPIRRYS